MSYVREQLPESSTPCQYQPQRKSQQHNCGRDLKCAVSRDFGAPGILFAPFATHLHSELPKQVGELAHMDQERQAHRDFLAGDADADALVLPSDLARVTWPLEPQWQGPYPRDSLAAACTALRRCDRACVTLEHMRDRVPEPTPVDSLSCHLFLRCLPRRKLMAGSGGRSARAPSRPICYFCCGGTLCMLQPRRRRAQTRALDGERVLVVAAVSSRR